MSDAPYPVPTLILKAPFDEYRGSVLKEWVDWNGHMNVGYYVVAFDHATGAIFDNIGLSYEYTRLKIGMYFVLEHHVTHKNEIKGGDHFLVQSQIIDFDHKRVHLFHSMFSAVDGEFVAANELMLINIDYASRRSAPWPRWAMGRIAAMAAAHAALPRPAQLGSVIGIRKPRNSSDQAEPRRRSGEPA